MHRVIRLQDVTLAIRRASIASKPRTPNPPPLRFTKPEKPKEPPKESSIEEAPSRTQAPPPPTFAKSRALPWVLSSLFAGGIGLYLVALYIEARKPCCNPRIVELSQQKDVSGKFDYTADSYDSEVGLSERLMLIIGKRKQLAKKCKGDVLEVSCGTGRNLGYYDISKNGQIDSLTLVDLSPQMIEICKKKWDVLHSKHKDDYFKPGMSVRFLTGSALDKMPPPPKKEKYDTIVQTLGLCSTPRPTELLLNMAEHLDVSNPEARILLLEHGRSYQQWLNRILDNSAERHAELHGCWFNRDIGAIVEDAAKEAGLEIVRERRHHWGTTWIFELKPSPNFIKPTTNVEDAIPEQQRQSSWRGWLGLT